MILLAAADPGAHDAFTLGYALTVVGTVAATAAALFLLRLITVAVHLPQLIDRVLARGDEQVADAADAMYAARRRPSVPRQLEGIER